MQETQLSKQSQFQSNFQKEDAKLQRYEQEQQLQYQYQNSQPTQLRSANNRRESTQIQCPVCNQVIMTDTRPNTCNLVTALWCIGAGLFCCFIPGCCKKQTEINHYCTNCNSHVGKKNAECL